MDWRLIAAAVLIVAGAFVMAWATSQTRETVIITTAPISQEAR